MGRRRSQLIMGQLQRQNPEVHKRLTRDIERLERETRSDGDPARLREACFTLLQVLEEHEMLLPFVSQGCPSCLPTLLLALGRDSADVRAEDNSDGDSDAMILRLAALLATSGTLIDAIADGVGRNLMTVVGFLFSSNPEAVQSSLSILSYALRLSVDGEKLAKNSLTNEKFWLKLTGAFFGSGDNVCERRGDENLAIPTAPPPVLAAVLSFLRCCYTVSQQGRGASLCSLLVCLCGVDAVRNDASVREEALLLLHILSLTASEEEKECFSGCIATLLSCVPAEDECDMVAPGAGAAAQSFVGLLIADCSNIPTKALQSALNSLQRNQFESDARLRDLKLIADLLFAPKVPRGAAAALLVVFPGAMTSVFAAASDVEEKVSAFACTIFVSAIDGLDGVAEALVGPKATAADQQQRDGQCCIRETDICFYRRRLIEDFLLLGGLILIEDLLLDYSSGVVATAARLVHSLMCFCDTVRNLVLASRCLPNLCKALENISQEPNLAETIRKDGEGGMCVLLLVALETFTLMGRDAAWLLPESAVGSISTIATEARDNAAVLSAALRAISVLAASHPLAATVVLDYEYINTVLATGATPGGDGNNEGGVNRCTLNDTDAAYLCGSFSIMFEIVSQKSSCITFEWIETLIGATHWLQQWRGGIPLFAYPLWKVVLQTLTVSEEGRSYLIEDTGFVDALLDMVTQCCTDIASRDREGLSDEKKAGENSAMSESSTTVPLAGSATQLLPILLRVTKFLPLPELPDSACDLLEGVAVLLSMRDNSVPDELLANAAISLRSCDATLFNTMLCVLSGAGPRVLLKLKQRALLALTRLRDVMEGSVQDALLRSKVLEEFESIVFVLYSLLSHCSTSGTCDVDEEIPMLASELVFAALKTSPDGLSTLFALPSNDALLLLPLHTRIICSIVGLLQQDHAVLRDLARILWTDHHILQRLSRVLCELGEAEEEQELRSTIYSLVLRLCTLCNTNVSTRGDGTDDIVSAFSLDVGYLLSFAAEHLLAGCWLQLSSCRSLFIHLCMHAPFRHGMHALHGEAYRMALMLVAEDSAQAGEKSLVDQWAKERSDDTLSELRA